MPAKTKLSLKQQRFITEYIKTGNATEAVRRAGYNAKDVNVATSIAYENLTKPAIAKVVATQLTKSEISPEWVLHQIRSIATSEAATKDRLRALELIGKHLRMFGDSSATNYIDSINITLGAITPPEQTIGLPKPQTIVDGTVVRDAQ